MITVIIVGEGQTEETFVRDVLAPAFAPADLFLEPRLIPTSRSGRGGALTYSRILRYLRNTLRQRPDTYVTTFFDLYALHPDFPGFAAGRAITDPLRRSITLEQELREAVVEEARVRADRFVPHIQPYEFEALLFTDTLKLTDIEPNWGTFHAALQAVRNSAPSPEHINDGPDTHPSAQLRNLRPAYRKTLHGPLAAGHIGLIAIEQACAHFAAWLQRLRSLPSLT
ncbi:MAG: DUF4276 family protein [Anaerolineales bacterium]